MGPRFWTRDLEVVLQSQLNLPLWDCDGGYDAGAARAVVDEVVGLGEVGVVEGVEDFRPEFQALRFGQGEFLA